MRLDTGHALRHVVCLPNPSRMQAARWEGAPKIRWSGVLFFLCCVVLAAGCNEGPVKKPTVSELAGTYALSDSSKKLLEKSRHYSNVHEAKIVIDVGGKIEFRELPDCAIDPFGYGAGKYVSGNGTLEVESTDWGYGLTSLISESATMGRGYRHASWLLLDGRQAPFRLKVRLGDPDNDEYLVLQKSS